MASVVFFRAANVGGHQVFQPGLLAKQLAEFDVVNVGAAGTFVVRGKISPSRLRDEILERLSFQPELMICSGRDVIELVQSDPFQDPPDGDDVKPFVSVLPKALTKLPVLPLDKPAGNDWSVRLVGLIGPFVLSYRRPQPKGNIYPNAIVEKHFALPATTRGWNTITNIRKILER